MTPSVRGKAGRYVDGSAQDTHIVGAFVDRNRRDGILVRGERVIVISSLVFNNSLESHGTYDGLVLDGAKRCLVTNNVFTNIHGRDRQRYGVTERGTSTKNIVAMNQFVDNAAGGTNRRADSSSQFALNVELSRRLLAGNPILALVPVDALSQTSDTPSNRPRIRLNARSVRLW